MDRNASWPVNDSGKWVEATSTFNLRRRPSVPKVWKYIEVMWTLADDEADTTSLDSACLDPNQAQNCGSWKKKLGV